uniref:Uncharacterized protein n=2 Tax=Emiliania huxleyi TaxID=2903 RepID=A0A7S3W878_EMIHU
MLRALCAVAKRTTLQQALATVRAAHTLCGSQALAAAEAVHASLAAAELRELASSDATDVDDVTDDADDATEDDDRGSTDDRGGRPAAAALAMRKAGPPRVPPLAGLGGAMVEAEEALLAPSPLPRRPGDAQEEHEPPWPSPLSRCSSAGAG